MTTKDRVLHAVQELPEDSSIEDVMERLLFMAKVERASNRRMLEKPLPMAKLGRRWLNG
jgi:hypothetical protein